MSFIDNLKKDIKDTDDFIFKEISIGKNNITLIYVESIASSDNINNFILKKISFLDKLNSSDLTEYLYNFLPGTNVQKLKDYNTLKEMLLNAFCVLVINQENILAIETRRDLSRGVSEADYEKTIVGPKDAFIEHYVTNLGLIRRRIKDILLSW